MVSLVPIIRQPRPCQRYFIHITCSHLEAVSLDTGGDTDVRKFDALMDLPEFQKVFSEWEEYVASHAPGRPPYRPATLAKLIL